MKGALIVASRWSVRWTWICMLVDLNVFSQSVAPTALFNLLISRKWIFANFPLWRECDFFVMQNYMPTRNVGSKITEIIFLRFAGSYSTGSIRREQLFWTHKHMVEKETSRKLVSHSFLCRAPQDSKALQDALSDSPSVYRLLLAGIYGFLTHCPCRNARLALHHCSCPLARD